MASVRPDVAHTAATFLDSFEFVIIDGCDGAGKTMLTAEISGRTSWSTLHNIHHAENIDLYKYYAQQLSGARAIVYDRSFTSEVVYGNALRGISRISDAELLQLADLTALRSGCFIHVRARLDTVVGRVSARGEVANADLLGRLTEAYADVFARITERAPVLTVETD